MKLAYLANVRFPSERAHAAQIAHMCQSFEQNDVKVTLFTNTRVGGDAAEVSKYFGFPVTFSIKRLSYGFFTPRIRFSYYFSEYWFAINFVLSQSSNQFNVIYSRHEWVLYLLSFFIDNKKLVWESHEAKLNFPAKKILRKGIKTVVISEGIYEDYIVFGVLKEKMLVAHDGIDESFFGKIQTKAEVRKKMDLPNEERIAMYIGGFDDWKGVESFFSASKLLNDVFFVAIGGTIEQVATFSMQFKRVKFLGQLPYADLKNNQQAADVLVIPNSSKTNLSSRYTSPLKLFAHMASGVPIVASDIPSIVTVTGRKLVTLVAPDNAQALAEGIRIILDNKEHKILAAQELRERSTKYLWKNRAKEINDFIK